MNRFIARFFFPLYLPLSLSLFYTHIVVGFFSTCVYVLGVIRRALSFANANSLKMAQWVDFIGVFHYAYFCYDTNSQTFNSATMATFRYTKHCIKINGNEANGVRCANGRQTENGTMQVNCLVCLLTRSFVCLPSISQFWNLDRCWLI